MSASVPEYLLTSSESPQTGGVAPANRPQSVTLTFSLPDSGLLVSESTIVPWLSTNVPARLPELEMSTSPVWAAAPGFMFDSDSTAEADLELTIVSVPDVNVFAGFAEAAVKS